MNYRLNGISKQTQIEDKMYLFPMEPVLNQFLGDPHVGKDVLLQSEHVNTDFYSTAMDGERMQQIYADFGKDFIALELFVDDVDPHNALASKGGVYKQFAVIGTIKNIKPFATGCLTNRFLFAIAFSTDASSNRYELIQRELVQQIKKCERVISFLSEVKFTPPSPQLLLEKSPPPNSILILNILRFTAFITRDKC